MLRSLELRLLLISFIVFSGSVTLSQNINDNGTLAFADLPDGDPYSITTGVIYVGGFTLKTTWNIIDGFLKIISPAGPPYSLITKALQGNLSFSTSLISEVQGNIIGFMVLFVLGLVFLLIFTLFLLLFCCCRLCGNCGGKMEQRNSSKFELKRYIYTSILLVALFFLLFAAVTALAVNGYTSSQVSNLPDTINNNIDDMLTYVNNTMEEIEFLFADQLSWTMDLVVGELEDVGDLVGVPVREGLRPTVGAAIDAVYPLAEYMSNTLSAMEDVNATQYNLEVLYGDLEDELKSIVIDLDNQCTSCSCCSGFDYTGLNMKMDPRDIQITGGIGTFPQNATNKSILELEDVVSEDLASAADKGKANFENIPTTLANATSDTVSGLIKTISDLQDTISTTISTSTSQLSQLDPVVSNFKNDLNPYLDSAVGYDAQRAIAMSLLFGVVLCLAGLFVIGVLCALVGHCLQNNPPANRSGLESCGGCIIMIAAVFSGMLVLPFLLISSFTFIIGGPVDRLLCDNLISLELFSETIDKPDAIVPGYFLGLTLFNDSSINLTVIGLLNACEQNASIYTAFKLDNLLNIAELTDTDALVGNVKFSNITWDFSDINILTNETRSILENFMNSSSDQISLGPFQDELSKAVTNDVNDGNDLSGLADIMRVAAASISPPNDKTAIENLANAVDYIQTDYMAPFITKKNTLVSQVYILTNLTGGIDKTVNDTINAADAAQDYLDKEAVLLVNSEIERYTDRVFGYVSQFTIYIENEIRNELGKCLPVYNFYSSSVNTLCVGFIQAFNGFWYCLGLCCITMIFTFAFGIKSAKYYRCMKKDYGFENHDYGFPLSDADSSKVTK